tara:strand:- start:55 stop:168 length:114 start_codon:yes stop_codon:yes gene_type:complete
MKKLMFLVHKYHKAVLSFIVGAYLIGIIIVVIIAVIK